MKSATDMSKVNGRFQRRIDRLFDLVMLVASVGPVERRIASYVALESMSAWEHFCEAFFFSCISEARVVGGARVRTSIQPGNHKAALTASKTILKPHRLWGPWGPKWRDRATLVHLSQALAFSNLGSVTRAASLPTAVLEDLGVVRNFYAHKSMDLERKALLVGHRYALPSHVEVSSMLFDAVPTSRNPLAFEWLCDLSALARTMTS